LSNYRIGVHGRYHRHNSGASAAHCTPAPWYALFAPSKTAVVEIATVVYKLAN